MNYNYASDPFLEITFPTRSVKVALFRYENIRQIKETVENGKPLVTIHVKSEFSNKILEWNFDGTMEEFKKNCKMVYL
jgi:hypothetical protein